jgi:N-acetylmuramoyl-L-alanine amidase
MGEMRSLRRLNRRYSRVIVFLIGLICCLSFNLSSVVQPHPVARPLAANSTPQSYQDWAHPTNFGERFKQDVNGKPIKNTYIIVLHETVASADSAVNFFKSPHPEVSPTSASYHAIIRRNGEIIYTVPFKYRAFGAGNSEFKGANGVETVQTNKKFPPSVNNFALHFSLETPVDGNHNGNTHSGYSIEQYRSLAWLTAFTKISESRITTHKAVDRSGSRKDPRSFDTALFSKTLRDYKRVAMALPT